MATKNVLTWKELKEFSNNLNEEQLNNEVLWWGEERGGKINFAGPLEADMVSTDEGWELKSTQEVDEYTTQEDIDNMEILPKGTPILYTDFPNE